MLLIQFKECYIFSMNSVQFAIKESKRLTFSFFKYKENERNFIETTLEKYLEDIGQISIANQISYCLHEQASNACKANSKRVYFNEKTINISNPADYQEGIKGFKDAIVNKQEHYFNLRRSENLYIKFQIKRDTQNLYISIINNVGLTKEEESRINDKIKQGSKYSSIIDAFDDIHDQQEGAGLGIFTMLIMLKEIGLKENSLKIFSKNGETHSTMVIKYQ